MRAELVLLGRRIDMASRMRRRVLVVSTYAAMAALMTAFWFGDHWRVSGYYMLFAVIAASRLFLGGTYAGGLVKPFNGKAPKESDAPPPLLLLKLCTYRPLLLEEGEYRSDERELHQRDRAHYRAYQAVMGALLLPFLILSRKLAAPAWMPIAMDELAYGLVLAILITALTLPQCILLWTEPDMEEAD